MNRLAVTLLVFFVFTNNANAKSDIESYFYWKVRTNVDQFDGSKNVAAIIVPKEGILSGIGIAITCVDGKTIMYLADTRGRISGNKIGFRNTSPDQVAFFSPALLSEGKALFVIDAESLVWKIERKMKETSIPTFLVRVEMNGLNKTFAFEMVGTEGVYQKVKDNCK